MNVFLICNQSSISFSLIFTSVEVIQKIREELLLQNQNNKVLESWTGDPCIFPWHGIECDGSNGSSVITKL